MTIEKRVVSIRSLLMWSAAAAVLTSCSQISEDYIQLTKDGENSIRTGDLERAEKLLTQAVTQAENARDDQRIGGILGDLATVYGARKDYKKASELYKRALECDEKAYGKDHEYVGFDLNNYAMFLDSDGHHKEAEPLLRRAVVVREHALGVNDPMVALTLSNLAENLKAQKRVTEAEPYWKKSIEIYRTKKDFASLNETLKSMADALDKAGQEGEAEKVLKEELAKSEKDPGPDSPFTSLTLASLAWHYQQKKQYQLEEPLLQRALTIQKRALGADHPATLTMMNNMAVVYCKQQKASESNALFESVMASAEKKKEFLLLMNTLKNYADCLEDQGRKADAENARKRAKKLEPEAAKPQPGSNGRPSYLSP